MRVDISGAVGEETTPNLSRDYLAELDAAVATAHDSIERNRSEFGYAALDPTPDIEAIRTTVDRFDPEAVLTVGIGGSALPAKALIDALASGPQAASRGGGRAVPSYFLDNVDPEEVAALLAELPLAETLVHVVSKSGTTTETMANFLVLRDAIEEAGGDWTEQTLVTTGDSGPLREIAAEHAVTTLPAPTDVPGRFGAWSPMGLVPAAACGYDLEELLAGARELADGLEGSLFSCPPYAYGATCYALAERGAGTNVLFPYAEALGSMTEWLAQLWAESLGKSGWGQTPVRAMGATDQHSQLQLYRNGPRDKLCTVLTPMERADREIPPASHESLRYLDGTTLGEVLATERRATAASLREGGCPTLRIDVEPGSRGIGRLATGLMAATILVGELAEVEAFTQPGVESGKRMAKRRLSGGEPGDPNPADSNDDLLVE